MAGDRMWDPLITIFNGRRRELGEGEKSAVYLQVFVEMRCYLRLFTSAEWMVFTAIALHIDENGWACPSVEPTLVAETGLCRDTVYKALSGLDKLKIEGRRVLMRYQPRVGDVRPIDLPKRGGGGRFASNHYLIFPSKAELRRYERAGVRHLGASRGKACIAQLGRG
jgi:hypothetical protein